MIGCSDAIVTMFSSWLRAQKSSPLIPQVDNAQQDTEMRVKNSEECMYVCMYLLIGKGQSAQKRPYWGEDRIKRKIYE